MFYVMQGNAMRYSHLLSGAVFATLFFAQASANANLIVNCDFETGTFSGWTASANSYPMYIVESPVQGSSTYAAQIAGYTYDPDTLSQVVSDTSGQEYVLSFWVDQTPYDETSANITLDVDWDGSTVFSQVVPTSPGYQNYTVTVTGTGSDTLEFLSANNPGFTYLDNVSLAPVPEPSTWTMLLLGFAGLGYAGYRRARAGHAALAA
jgi:Carbohydrate binding domain/PEP-CTERM motif